MIITLLLTDFFSVVPRSDRLTASFVRTSDASIAFSISIRYRCDFVTVTKYRNIDGPSHMIFSKKLSKNIHF